MNDLSFDVEGAERAYLDTLRQGDGPRELAVAALANGIAVLIVLGGDLRLTRNGEHVVVHVNVNVLLLQAGKLKGGKYDIVLGVLVHIHPARKAT